MKISRIINKVKLYRLKKKGMIVGKNFTIESRVRIDNGFPWLVEIGDNVTLAPEVMILTHDASPKKTLGFGSIGKVVIGNNVFIGAKSIILSNTKIGNNCIIGAGSVVTKDIPDNSVACGNPARVIKSFDEFKDEKKDNYKNGIVYQREEIKNARHNKNVRNKIKNSMGSSKAFIGVRSNK